MLAGNSIPGFALFAVDAATAARVARGTPSRLLRAVASGPTRALVVAQVFRRMPAQLKPSSAPPDVVVRWDVKDEGRPTESWYLIFEEGRCTTTKRPRSEREPRVTFTVGAYDLLRLAVGAESPMTLFQEGRIRIAGDLFFAAQLQSAFTIPR